MAGVLRYVGFWSDVVRYVPVRQARYRGSRSIVSCSVMVSHVEFRYGRQGVVSSGGSC